MGRPKGSKNKKKTGKPAMNSSAPKRRGRPPGYKYVGAGRPPMTAKRRGRPAGSKNATAGNRASAGNAQLIEMVINLQGAALELCNRVTVIAEKLVDARDFKTASAGVELAKSASVAERKVEKACATAPVVQAAPVPPPAASQTNGHTEPKKRGRPKLDRSEVQTEIPVKSAPKAAIKAAPEPEDDLEELSEDEEILEEDSEEATIDELLE